MLKKKFLKIVTTLACIATLILPHTSVVLATAVSNDKDNENYLEDGIIELAARTVHSNGKKYRLFKTSSSSGDGTDIIKIERAVKQVDDDGNYIAYYDDKGELHYKYNYTSEDTIYCLNGRASFIQGNDQALTYKRVVEDYFDSSAENKQKIKDVLSYKYKENDVDKTHNFTDDDYKALYNLFYNAYIMSMSEEEKNEYLEKVFEEELNKDTLPKVTVDDIKTKFDESDLNVLQQWAIWCYTNRNHESLEHVPYRENLNEIIINLSTGDSNIWDAMSETKRAYSEMFYNYLISKAKASSLTEIVYPELRKTVECCVEGNNYKIGPFNISKPSDNVECVMTLFNGETKITTYTVKDSSGNEITDSINSIFDKDYYIYLPKAMPISNLKFNISYRKTMASIWEKVDDPEHEYQPVVLLTKEPQNITVNIGLPQPDLALRKYIVKVNDKEITDRQPNVDTTNLKNGSSKTATYKGKKSPVEVRPGDKVTFRIEVYNEGSSDAKANEIVDYLPEGLELIENDSQNQKFKWSKNDDGYVVTDYLKDTTINAFNKSTGEITSKYVDVVCKVLENNENENILTNIAEIKGDDIEDRDSTPDNIKNNQNVNLMDLTDYKGKDNKDDLTDSNYYYKGQEDDDDFEKVIVKIPQFDLSLQKFITKINGKDVESREPKVDTSDLKNGKKDAKYTTVKEPKLKVKVGDIVKYTIRVYNEGEVNGYAEEVADYLPEGLGYLVDYKENDNNKWSYPENAETIKLSDIKNATKKVKISDFNNIEKLDDVKVVKGTVKLTSTKLDSSKTSNLLKAFDGTNKLDYKDIEVTCIVISDKNLKNIAEVNKNLDEEKNDITDRDSTPDNYFKDDGTYNKEDDDDYEELVTKIFDLALQKFITKVNDTKIEGREPTPKITDGKISYEHPSTPVEVKNGDKVTYTIRVYNEGPTAGYAAEIGDNIPEGLKFDPENETNKKYGWKMYDADKKETDDVSKAVEIRTDYLSMEKAEEREEDTLLTAFNETRNEILAKDVEVVFIVDTNSFDKAIVNIAEITKNTDEDGEDITDIDSTPDNKKDGEDDLDKERVIVKPFDLSLQKFITKLNGKNVEPSREPVVDTKPLVEGKTDAKYTTVKNPLIVETGDIVTYKIRVYNEGGVNGYAEQVADYLPEGLGYLVNYNANIDNYWALPTDLSKENTVKLNAIENGTKNLDIKNFKDVKDLNNVDVVKGSVKLTSTLLNSGNKDNLLKAFDGSNKLSYKDIEVTCIVLSDTNLRNIAEVTKNLDENKKEVTDRDSTPDTVNPKDYPGADKNQDDNDYEILTAVDKKFDLSLQKFITGVNGKTIKDREPKASFENGKLSYSHPTTPLEVNTGDSVTYSIRVYNEGDIDGYAAEIGDDIPNGLTFDPNNEVNKKYGWVMYDANKKVTADSNKAVEIRTDYLSKEKSEARKENTLIKAFNAEKGDLFYLDVQAVFTVSIKSADSTVINTAEITKDTDKDGKEIDDIDSTPDNKKDGEDDLDKERIHVGYFDLALVKDLKKAIVTQDGTTKEVNAKNGKLTKIEINRKKLNSTVVKFVYDITIKNEGTIPGYAKEITDYIPEGLEFVAEDNKSWKAGSNGTITSDALANTLIQPGQTASVEVVLRWKNGENNLGMKTNVAEISKDYNEAGDTDDVDSTPNNKKDGEDDIDDAPVILSISTGRAQTYFIISTAVLVIISTGVVMIKKYVLNK